MQRAAQGDLLHCVPSGVRTRRSGSHLRPRRHRQPASTAPHAGGVACSRRVTAQSRSVIMQVERCPVGVDLPDDVAGPVGVHVKPRPLAARPDRDLGRPAPARSTASERISAGARPMVKVISAGNGRPRFSPGRPRSWPARRAAPDPWWRCSSATSSSPTSTAGAVLDPVDRIVGQPDLPAVHGHAGRGAGDLVQPGAVDHQLGGGDPGEPGRLGGRRFPRRRGRAGRSWRAISPCSAAAPAFSPATRANAPASPIRLAAAEIRRSGIDVRRSVRRVPAMPAASASR